MSLQSLFDDVVTHLLTQMEKSTVSGPTTCSYRGVDGTMCAVGCLISDDVYEKGMEGKMVSGLFEEYPIVFHQIMEKYELHGYREEIKNMLERLQYIHDDRSVTAWEEELRKCARINDLQFNWKGEEV